MTLICFTVLLEIGLHLLVCKEYMFKKKERKKEKKVMTGQAPFKLYLGFKIKSQNLDASSGFEKLRLISDSVRHIHMW